MKTNNVQGGKAGTHNTQDKSTLPKGDVKDTGVKNGVGIPGTTGDKKINSNHSGSQSNNTNRRFSNERPIF